MDLMSIYDTEFSTDHTRQAYIGRTRAHDAQQVLHRFFGELIDISRQRYRDQTPIVHPHKFQDPTHDTTQDTIELIYLHAEDACDILNLFPRPPEGISRMTVVALAARIEELSDIHERRASMAGTPRIAFYQPTLEQAQAGILVPDQDVTSLYKTPHNELLVNLPTPNLEALDEPHETLGEVRVTPITLTQHGTKPISTYVVPPTSACQLNLLPIDMPPPDPIIRNFTPTSPFNDVTYIINNGMNAILKVYKEETEVRLRKIDEDPEHGANIFDTSHS